MQDKLNGLWYINSVLSTTFTFIINNTFSGSVTPPGSGTMKKQKLSPQDTWMSRELGGMVAPQFSAQAIEHKLIQHHKKHHPHHLKHLGTQKGGVSVIIDGTQITLAKPQTSSRGSSRKRIRHLKLKHKLKAPKQQANQLNNLFWKL